MVVFMQKRSHKTYRMNVFEYYLPSTIKTKTSMYGHPTINILLIIDIIYRIHVKKCIKKNLHRSRKLSIRTLHRGNKVICYLELEGTHLWYVLVAIM
jgi:hypothetical protein